MYKKKKKQTKENGVTTYVHQSFKSSTAMILNNTWENIEEKESYQSSVILKKTGQEHSYVTTARLSNTLQTQMIDGTVSMYLNNKIYIYI